MQNSGDKNISTTNDTQLKLLRSILLPATPPRLHWQTRASSRSCSPFDIWLFPYHVVWIEIPYPPALIDHRRPRLRSRQRFRNKLIQKYFAGQFPMSVRHDRCASVHVGMEKLKATFPLSSPLKKTKRRRDMKRRG